MKELWGLFISYKSGGHYIGVYLTLEHTLGVVQELLEETYKSTDETKNDNLPEVIAAEMEQIKETVNIAGYWDKHDDYWHSLNDGMMETTWFTIQPIGETLVNAIKKAWEKTPMEKGILNKYVKAFDNKHGMPESVFDSVYALIKTELGKKSAEVFSKHIRATDGAFYFKEGTFEEAWKDILGAAEPTPANK